MAIPKFWSLEFHTRFFPALLGGRLRPRERAGTGFSPPLEFPVVFVICGVIFVAGLPMAIDGKSIIGWAMGGLGAVGMLALIINAIVSHKEPPDYEGFLVGVFIFSVMLGLTTGVFAGTLQHSLQLGLLAGTAGVIAGYALGILAGLWFQHLGWLAPIVSGLAGLMALGMFVVDLVLLSGALQ